MILIARPCVIESKEIVFKIAKELEFFAKNKEIDFYFKASFDKANRTSLDSFRGPGLKEGLKILKEVKDKFGYKILTDIHETNQVKEAAKVVDILQIPAFLCRQTDLIVECAKTDKIINIKKGQFLNPYDIKYQVQKALITRGFKEVDYKTSKEAKVFVTERGSSFGYSNLVVDFRSLVIMREFAPVIFDATHSVQMPGAGGGKSSGKKEFVEPLSKAAAAVGVDGFFFETHIDPSIAKSDKDNMLTIDELKDVVKKIFKIKKALQES